MKKQENFGRISWITVILFAVTAGIYTGIVMGIPAFTDTSVQDIGISYEWWVIFAVLIVIHCSRNWEAMLKCFVFFLISQPLVYITEILMGTLSPEMGWYYYRIIWFRMTLLTLPGGFLAYYCKKQNLFGCCILGLANTIQTMLAAVYLKSTMQQFPHHLISAAVCVLSVLLMSFLIQRKKKYQLISLLIPIILTAALLVCLKATGRVLI